MIKHARRNLDIQFVVFDGTNLSEVIELCGEDWYVKKFNCPIETILQDLNNSEYYVVIHDSIGVVKVRTGNVIVLDDGLMYLFDDIEEFHKLYDEYEEIV